MRRSSTTSWPSPETPVNILFLILPLLFCSSPFLSFLFFFVASALPQLLAIFRFASLILAYAVCKLRHWWAIAVSLKNGVLLMPLIRGTSPQPSAGGRVDLWLLMFLSVWEVKGGDWGRLKKSHCDSSLADHHCSQLRLPHCQSHLIKGESHVM